MKFLDSKNYLVILLMSAHVFFTLLHPTYSFTPYSDPYTMQTSAPKTQLFNKFYHTFHLKKPDITIV